MDRRLGFQWAYIRDEVVQRLSAIFLLLYNTRCPNCRLREKEKRIFLKKRLKISIYKEIQYSCGRPNSKQDRAQEIGRIA